MHPITLNDSNRKRCLITFYDPVPSTGEVLLSITKQIQGVNNVPATSIDVTPDKRLRITSFSVCLRTTTAVAMHLAVRVRSNPVGATIITSPISLLVYLGLTQAVNGGSLNYVQQFPEGLEFEGNETIGISMNTPATSNLVSIVLAGYEYNP